MAKKDEQIAKYETLMESMFGDFSEQYPVDAVFGNQANRTGSRLQLYIYFELYKIRKALEGKK